MSDFAHLHVHTSYSFLDGAARVDDMVSKAKRLGFPAMAITDHGFLHGWPEFQIACDEEGIQPILGVEAYIVDDLEDVYRDKDLKDPEIRKAANKQLSSPCHQVLLAMNDEGLKNITRLVSVAASANMHYRRPVIDMKRLAAHAEGVIATTSCMSGLIPRAIRDGDTDAVERYVRWYKDTFGDRFYFEVHNHGIEEEKVIRDAIVGLSVKHDVPVICANDVHYVEKDDFKTQSVLVQMAFGKKGSEGSEYAHERLHLATEDEMATLFGRQFPKSLEQTLDLAGRCDARLPFGRGFVLPAFAAPDGGSEFDYLVQLCHAGMPKRYPGAKRAAAEERLTYELNTLRTMQAQGVDFARYFLITADMTSAARAKGIWVGPGRGSAAGSIVSYLLGVTNIDPIAFDLLFERFLNPERVSMPDIDIDFEDARREEVFDYLKEKYGDESVTRIITFSKIGTKSAIRDLARTFEISIAESDRLSEKVTDPSGGKETEFSAQWMNDPYVQAKAEKDDRVGRIMDLGPKIFGLSKQTGVHPCGVVITPGPVTDYIPTCAVKARGSSKEAISVTQFEGDHIESLGLLKLDILGLKTGSILHDTLDVLRDRRGIHLELDDLPLDDHKTFALLQKGLTDGVFQLESPGMKEWLVKLKPEDMEDLIAMVALYRPGPMKLIPHYIARKHGREEVAYAHPSLEAALKSTYGIAIYQEQVMQMARILAGFSLGQADILRKAMGKKKMRVMDEMRPKFISGCWDTHGIDETQAVKLFGLIESFAQYGFNRSHAAAYALVAYQTAYLKANYPVEFMALTIEHNARNVAEKSKYLQATRNLGIKVLPPAVNASALGFTTNHEKHAIYYGMQAVKGVSEEACVGIISERATGGDYKDFSDFLTRVAVNANIRVTSNDIASLVKVGGFDTMGDRAKLLWELDQYLPWIRRMRDYSRGQDSIAKSGSRGSHRKSIPDIPTITRSNAPKSMPFEEKLRNEMDLMGQFVSGHPMQGMECTYPLIGKITDTNPNMVERELFQAAGRQYTSLIGYVVSTSERKIKNGANAGKSYLLVGLLVEDRIESLFAWPETYERYESFLEVDQRLWVLANPRGDSLSIEAIVPLAQVISDWVCGIDVQVAEKDVPRALRILGPDGGRAFSVIRTENESLVGPDVDLNARQLRDLSKLGEIRVF